MRWPSVSGQKLVGETPPLPVLGPRMPFKMLQRDTTLSQLLLNRVNLFRGDQRKLNTEIENMSGIGEVIRNSANVCLTTNNSDSCLTLTWHKGGVIWDPPGFESNYSRAKEELNGCFRQCTNQLRGLPDRT